MEQLSIHEYVERADRGRPPTAIMVLARVTLVLLHWAVRKDADQVLVETYDELKPVLERLVRRGK